MHPLHPYRRQPGKRRPVNSHGKPGGLEPTPACGSFSNSNRLSASLTVPRASQSSDATLHEKRPLLGQSRPCQRCNLVAKSFAARWTKRAK